MANPKLAPASQSFMDELNASRERRPVPQAMQELERTLAGLERRLLDFDIEEEEPAEPAHHHAPQHITNSAAGLAEITENLRRRLDSRKEAHSLRTSLEDNFTRRLNEVFDQTAAGEREPDPEAGLRLERIENRLSDLTRQLDTAVAQHDSDLIYQKLGLLSQRIDALSDGSALPGSMAGQLAEQIGLLASRVAKVMDHLSQTDYHAFEERLDLIGRKLEAVEHRAAEPHPAVLDRIDCRFSELTERFNAQYASLHRDTGAIHALENRMDDLSEQISEGLRQARLRPSTARRSAISKRRSPISPATCKRRSRNCPASVRVSTRSSVRSARTARTCWTRRARRRKAPSPMFSNTDRSANPLSRSNSART